VITEGAHRDGLDASDIAACPDTQVEQDGEPALFLGTARPLLHTNLLEGAEPPSTCRPPAKRRTNTRRWPQQRLGTAIGHPLARSLTRVHEHAPWIDDAIHVGVSTV
jgi:hypothetical protein